MDDIRSVWSIIGKDLSSLDGLPLQQRIKCLAVTVVKNSRVSVVAFDE